MLYSKTAKYAVLALAEVAARASDDPVATKQIAEATSSPYPLLAKIINQLHRAGFIEAIRGKQGGIRLARPASEITIKDVVLALDGSAILSDCPLYLDPCDCSEPCALHAIWKPARDAVVEFLEKTTIQAVVDACTGSKASSR